MPVKDPFKEYRNFIIGSIAAGILLFFAGYFFFSSSDYLLFQDVWTVISGFWWLIFPVPVYLLFRTAWDEYRELTYLINIKTVLLEFNPPSDVEKSPRIMEQIFTGLHTWSKPNMFEHFCGWRPLQDKFTFEIANNGDGKVHFYFRCPEVARDLVEALVYAQYPAAEIFEAEDYTKNVPVNLPNRDWDVWGTVLRKINDDTKNEEKEIVPIRTYPNFKEDVTGKMIDPLASLVEVMNKCGKNEQIWLQISFTPLNEPDWVKDAKEKVQEIAGKKKPKKKGGKLDAYVNDFKDIIGNLIPALGAKDLEFTQAEEEKDEAEDFSIQRLTPGEQKKVEAIQHNITKVAFGSLIRFVYIGKRGEFNKARGVAGTMGAIKQFNDNYLSSLTPNNDTKTFANYYFREPRLRYRQRKIVYDYRVRAFAGLNFLMTAEELATIFHLPNVSVEATSIGRIESRKGSSSKFAF